MNTQTTTTAPASKKDRSNSQTSVILRHLRRLGTISFAEAWDAYGIRSLTRRICDLKEMGHNIQAVVKMHPVTNQRYTRYYLVRS